MSSFMNYPAPTTDPYNTRPPAWIMYNGLDQHSNFNAKHLVTGEDVINSTNDQVASGMSNSPSFSSCALRESRSRKESQGDAGQLTPLDNGIQQTYPRLTHHFTQPNVYDQQPQQYVDSAEATLTNTPSPQSPSSPLSTNNNTFGHPSPQQIANSTFSYTDIPNTTTFHSALGVQYSSSYPHSNPSAYSTNPQPMQNPYAARNPVMYSGNFHSTPYQMHHQYTPCAMPVNGSPAAMTTPGIGYLACGNPQRRSPLGLHSNSGIREKLESGTSPNAEQDNTYDWMKIKRNPPKTSRFILLLRILDCYEFIRQNLWF